MKNKLLNSVAILGIETSCDDTSAAICLDGKIISNIVSQQHIHKNYGGIVPELASRNHERNIIPVVKECLKKACISKNQLTAISFTYRPGLLGSLIVGVSFSKSFALALNIPIIACNHITGHIMSNYINNKISYPFICLIISGGHTQLLIIKDFLNIIKIGNSIDDAVGETLDKIGVVLGFKYPCGAIIELYAKKGNKKKFFFPKPNIKNYDFSFSGFKTSVIYFIRKKVENEKYFIKNNLHDLCASIQYNIINILLEKIIKAATDYQISCISIVGGVAANNALRKEIIKLSNAMNWKYIMPDIKYCTDNAAMIAILGYYKYLNNELSNDNVSALSYSNI